MTEVEQLKKRIEELEAEVAKLKAGTHVIHSHYHYQGFGPVYLPQPTWVPTFPQVTYGGQGIGSSGNAT